MLNIKLNIIFFRYFDSVETDNGKISRAQISWDSGKNTIQYSRLGLVEFSDACLLRISI